MFFPRGSLKNPYKNQYQKNPLLKGLLVYANTLDDETELTIAELEGRIDDLALDLHGESDTSKRSKIESDIQRLSSIRGRLISAISHRAVASDTTIDILEKNLAATRAIINLTPEGPHLNELKRREKTYARLKEELGDKIESVDHLNNTVERVDSINRLKKKLATGEIDQVDLEFLLDSELSAFFNLEFRHELEKAQATMMAHNDVWEAFRGGLDDESVHYAEMLWGTNPPPFKARIDELKTEQKEIENLIARGGDGVNYPLTRARSALEENQAELRKNLVAKESWITKQARLMQAERQWPKREEEIRTNIDELRRQKREMETGLDASEIDTGTKRKLKDIDRLVGYLEDEIKSGKEDWLKRRVTELEVEQGRGAKLTSNVDKETLADLERKLEEIRHLQLERSYDYLDSEFRAIEAQFEHSKQAFDADSQAAIQKEMEEARKLLLNRDIEDPALLRQIARNFEESKGRFESIIAEAAEVRENRPEIEENIRRQFARLQAALPILEGGYKGSSIEEYRRKILEAELKEGRTPNNSAILRKQLDALNFLEGGDARALSYLSDLDTLISVGFYEVSDEELQSLNEDLDLLARRIFDRLEAQDAASAHEAIERIENGEVTNIESFMRVMDETVGIEKLENHKDATGRMTGDPSKHAKIIPEAEFIYYRGYTQGKMVVTEIDDEWYILINETALDEGEDLGKLLKQITHELLHVEFEKGAQVLDEDSRTYVTVKDKLRREFVEKNPEYFHNVLYPAWLEECRETGKLDPDGNPDWPNIDDSLSEWYGMQKEAGNRWIEEPKNAAERFNNALFKAGQNIELSIPKERIRGYQAGSSEEGEESFDPDSSPTYVETKGIAEASYGQNAKVISDLEERLASFAKNSDLPAIPGAVSLVKTMQGFNNVGTRELNEKLKSSPEDGVLVSEIQKRLGMVRGDIVAIQDALGKFLAKQNNEEMGLMRRLWINTNFISISDFVQMGVDVKEFIERRHNRKKKDHAARLGMGFFSGTSLGREAKARQQKAEDEEVNEWKGRYDKLDVFALEKELKNIADSAAPNADQLKAILRILANDKGRFDIRNQDLWRALNKLQSASYFKPGDTTLLKDPNLLNDKMYKALGALYDYDEFNALIRASQSTYESEKKKNDTTHERTQTKLTSRLDELLAEHMAGENVDPILYESIIEYCITQGKSYAENVMFHLIAGMGTGLLAPDRGLVLAKHLNVWPPVDWFTVHNPPYTQEDWHRLCMRYFKDSYQRGSLGGGGLDFKNWFWTEVQNTPRVLERVVKSVGERGWDHDWGRSIACLGDSKTAKRFLSGKAGQEETKVTAVGNAYVGAVQWIEENAKNPGIATRKDFARMAGWIAMSEGILSGAAYNSGSGDISTRANASMNDSVPREAGVGRHGNDNLQTHRNKVSTYLNQLDPIFFEMIKVEARSKEMKQALGKAAAKHIAKEYPGLAEEMAGIEEVDQIYDRIDLIIGEIFRTMPESKFQEILKNYAPPK